jgi:hypothetical protein
MARSRCWLLALAILAPAAGRASAQSLLTNRSIHDELKLTPEQSRKLDALDERWRAESRERTRKLLGLPVEERRKKAQEGARERMDDLHRKMGEILSPAHAKRYDQILVQNAGFAAFTFIPSVRERLKFTEGQEARLREIQEDLNRQAGPRSALMEKYREDPEGMRKKSDEATAAAIAKVIALMTDEQKKTWADLTGPPFKIRREPIPAP